jgi:hypothetical protein
MPGRDNTYIPKLFRDDDLRQVPLFNPVMRWRKLPDNTDFSHDEWQLVRREAYRTRPRTWWLAMIPSLAICGLLSLVLRNLGQPPLAAILLGCSPLFLSLLINGRFSELGHRNFRGVAFVNVTEREVARALLLRNRCPSCAYRLPYADLNRRARCSECGAVWRSRNIRPPVRRQGGSVAASG